MATEGGKRLIKFGEQRLIRPNIGILERSLFRVLGIADPASALSTLSLPDARIRYY